MAESGKIVLFSCIVDFIDMQVSLSQLSLNLMPAKLWQSSYLFSPKFGEDHHKYSSCMLQENPCPIKLLWSFWCHCETPESACATSLLPRSHCARLLSSPSEDWAAAVTWHSRITVCLMSVNAVRRWHSWVCWGLCSSRRRQLIANQTWPTAQMGRYSWKSWIETGWLKNCYNKANIFYKMASVNCMIIAYSL